MSLRVNNAAREWASTIKFTYGRKQLANYEAGLRLVEKLNLKDQYKDTTIIEGYPGPGVWTAALNNVLKPKSHILMEPHPQCAKHLTSLVTPENGLKISTLDPYRWRSFRELQADNIFSPTTHPRTEIHPHILFTANLSMTQGEQLVTQYLNCITNESWLEAFGRVRLLLWVRPSTALKLLYRKGDISRSRVSVQAEACTDISLLTGNNEDIQPTSDMPLLENLEKADFFPVRVGLPVLIQIDPKEKMPENLDSFEFVTKMIFIQRTRPLREGINTLGAGAYEDLGPKLGDLMDVKPRDMTLGQIMQVVNVFDMWPFKPEILHDFYEQTESSGGFAL